MQVEGLALTVVDSEAAVTSGGAVGVPGETVPTPGLFGGDDGFLTQVDLLAVPPDADDAEIVWAVADAYLYLRMTEEAEAQYKITLQKDPADPLLPLLGLGSAYTELRDWDKASRTFAETDGLLAQRKQALTWNDSVLAEKRY